MDSPEGRTENDLGMIFREFGQEYERTHDMTSEQRTVLNALSQCRNVALRISVVIWSDVMVVVMNARPTTPVETQTARSVRGAQRVR